MSPHESDRTASINRRQILLTIGSTSIAGLAGCLADDDDDDTTIDDGDDSDDTDDGDDGDDTAPAHFAINSIEISEASFAWGKPFDATAEIENQGETAEGTQIAFEIDGEEIDSVGIALDPGETKDASIQNVDSGEWDSGDHDISAVSPDDEASTGVTFTDRLGEDPTVLVYSATFTDDPPDEPKYEGMEGNGFRHNSTEAGNQAIEAMSESFIADYPWKTNAESVTVDVIDHETLPSEEFPDTVDELQQYAVVVFNNTSRDVLFEDQQTAFQSYIENGGAFAGIHSASATFYDWEWYGDLVGAYFDQHPHPQDADVRLETTEHPSTAHLTDPWERFDEWYDWIDMPGDEVELLLSVDNTTYDGSVHEDGLVPNAWYQDTDTFRSWYTAGGHTTESFEEEEEFITHLRRGIMWAAGWYETDDLD